MGDGGRWWEVCTCDASAWSSSAVMGGISRVMSAACRPLTLRRADGRSSRSWFGFGLGFGSGLGLELGLGVGVGVGLGFGFGFGLGLGFAG